jgi:hypothetical protein
MSRTLMKMMNLQAARVMKKTCRLYLTQVMNLMLTCLSLDQAMLTTAHTCRCLGLDQWDASHGSWLHHHRVGIDLGVLRSM